MTDNQQAARELLPCPFCGSEPDIGAWAPAVSKGIEGATAIECASGLAECNVNPSVTGFTRHEAAAAWNMRVYSPASWIDSPTERGWYWHDDGDVMRVLFVFERPGHRYLAVQEEPSPLTGKRSFRMAEKIGGKWMRIVPPLPAPPRPTQERQQND